MTEDTSFNVLQFERELAAERKTRRAMSPLMEMLEPIERMMRRKFPDSPRMQEWIDYLVVAKPGETREERDRRRACKFEELWPPFHVVTEFNDGG